MTTRPVAQVADAARAVEGGGFPVRRPFASVDLSLTDPFLLLDEMGPIDYGPGEAKGAPDHPHRGFETVTYMLAGGMEHRDSSGGGGVIRPGDTQWMTAGSGLIHSELPLPEMLRDGGRMHGLQLWVNLPRAQKMTPPRYQLIAAEAVSRFERDGALVRVIAGEVDGHRGTGQTRTPITYAHASLAENAIVDVEWPSEYNALVFVFAGLARVADEYVGDGQMAVLGPGDRIRLEAVEPTEAILLGGAPIREPIAWYGPFVMNTKAEIIQAVDDYEAGTLGGAVASGA